MRLERGLLQYLGEKHQTDKSMENLSKDRISYLHFYEQYLQPFRHQPINILEIGVRSGASLRMWREYFTRARIVGLDNDPACKQHEGDRISVEIGDQSDPASLEKACSQVRSFDIIIDDGCHLIPHILASFQYLFPRLSSKGLYIIEDLNNTYGKWGNNRRDIVPFFSSLIESVDANSEGQSPVLSVHFWPNVCMIIKA